MRPLRILVTASRDLTDRSAIRDGLAWALATYTTIGLPELWHGAAVGGDTLADEEWTALAWSRPGWLAKPRRFPAKDFASPAARNQYMVNQGPTCCLAFALSWASGTGQTARMARKAGIPTRDFGVDTRIETRL